MTRRADAGQGRPARRLCHDSAVLLPLSLLLPVALAGPLPEPLPADTTLLESAEHADFVRFKLHTDRDFYIELTPSRPGATPVCSGGGFDLYVRLSLEPNESFDWEPLPAVVDATCARLESDPPRLAAKSAPLPVQAPAGFRPLMLLALPLGLLLLWALRGRDALAVLGVALGLRLLASPRTIQLGGDAPYELLLMAQGQWGTNPRYGDTWAAILGPMLHLGGDVHLYNLLFSAMTAALLVPLARSLGAERGEAAVAGLLLACAPLAVGLAATETHAPMVALLQLAAIEGAIGKDRSASFWSAISVALLVNLRPEQLAFAPLPIALLFWQRRWLSALVGAGFFIARAAELAPQLGQGVALIGPQRALSFGFVRGFLLPGPHAPNTWLDPLLTPALVPALVAVGVLALLRDRRWLLLGVPLAAFALGVGPTLTKTWPLSDPMRFQLPGVAWWALLASAGLAALWRWRPLAGGLAGLALLLSAGLCRVPFYAWSAEYDFLRTVQLPEGQAVSYDSFWDENGHFAEWLHGQVGGVWADQAPGPDALIYVGTADALSGRTYPCGLQPVQEQRISALSDGWVDFGAESLTIGLYRCR